MKTFQEFLNELAYDGNVGIMELIKFNTIATPEHKKLMKQHIADGDGENILKLMKHYNINLHKSAVQLS